MNTKQMHNTVSHLPEALLLILLQASGFAELVNNPVLKMILEELPLQVASFGGALIGVRIFKKESLSYIEWFLTAISGLFVGYGFAGFWCEWMAIATHTKTGWFVHMAFGLCSDFLFRGLKVLGERMIIRLPEIADVAMDSLKAFFGFTWLKKTKTDDTDENQ